MISSFHRLSEKKKTNEKSWEIITIAQISIESKVQKHSEFISILFSLAKLSSSIIFWKNKNRKYIWECKRIEKKDNTYNKKD